MSAMLEHSTWQIPNTMRNISTKNKQWEIRDLKLQIARTIKNGAKFPVKPKLAAKMPF